MRWPWPRVHYLDAREFPHSLFQDAHDLEDATIADAHELGDTRRGGSTWRLAVQLVAHPPTAPVLPSSFSSASAAPSPSASAAPFGPCLAAAPEASPCDLRKLR
jgi:hypothetical protein